MKWTTRPIIYYIRRWLINFSIYSVQCAAARCRWLERFGRPSACGRFGNRSIQWPVIVSQKHSNFPKKTCLTFTQPAKWSHFVSTCGQCCATWKTVDGWRKEGKAGRVETGAEENKTISTESRRIGGKKDSGIETVMSRENMVKGNKNRQQQQQQQNKLIYHSTLESFTHINTQTQMNGKPEVKGQAIHNTCNTHTHTQHPRNEKTLQQQQKAKRMK